MKHIRLLCLVLCVMAIALSSAQIGAQGAPDTDGDGLPDTVDNCPTVPGPRANGGCPWPTEEPSSEQPGGPTRIPGDYDGDGTRDDDDTCPEESGPDWNAGCPAEAGETPEPIVLPDIPPDGPHLPHMRSCNF